MSTAIHTRRHPPITSARAAVGRFARDEAGGPTVEYVLIFLPLMTLIFFVFEIAIAYHFTLTANKATALGARLAAVSQPVHTGAPGGANNEDWIYQGQAGAENGEFCMAASAPCVPVTQTWTCSGANVDATPGNDAYDAQCNANAFNAIYAEMRKVAAVDKEDVSVTYSDSGLGRVGAPFVPYIEVSIAPRSFAVDLLVYGQRNILPRVASGIIGEGMGVK